MGIPEDEEWEMGAENLLKEIIADNFPNLGKELDIQVQKANKAPIYLNRKSLSPRHVLY